MSSTLRVTTPNAAAGGIRAPWAGSWPVAKPTTFVRRRTRQARLPLTVVTVRSDGRCDFECVTCRVAVSGLADETAAKGWADSHHCDNNVTTSQRRPWP